MRAAATGTYLDRILENTVDQMRQRMTAQPIETLLDLIEHQREPISLVDALAGTDNVSIIAEFKRASPSRGEIAPGVEAAGIAREYLRGGCAAVSVLTDERFFQGTLADLRDVSALAHAAHPARPVLRKDFVISPYQILEARAHGADAILLIVAALEDGLLGELHALALERGMGALVEVHDEQELERALAASPAIIGINNRDLRTFDVDLAMTERLAPLVPEGVAIVGESGIHTRDDVLKLEQAGVDAVLVGESLMRQPDRAQAVRKLLGA